MPRTLTYAAVTSPQISAAIAINAATCHVYVYVSALYHVARRTYLLCFLIGHRINSINIRYLCDAFYHLHTK